MKNSVILIFSIAMSFAGGFLSRNFFSETKEETFFVQKEPDLRLGAFSISLSVKDLNASKLFYEQLGFVVFGGGMEKNYLIMKNENALIGLFLGMFQGNMLTFNPGWDENAQKLASFVDVREIQRRLKAKGVKLVNEVKEESTGPAGFVVIDPNGNTILIDQHVGKP